MGSNPVSRTTSEEACSVPLSRFAKEPEKLHIRRLLLPFQIGGSHGGTSDLVYSSGNFSIKIGQMARIRTRCVCLRAISRTTSEEACSVPLSRFAKEPEKLHIRRLLLPFQIGGSHGGTSDLVYSSGNFSIKIGQMARIRTRCVCLRAISRTTSEEACSVPLSRFAKEPEKLHIRRLLLPFQIGGSHGGTSDLVYTFSISRIRIIRQQAFREGGACCCADMS